MDRLRSSRLAPIAPAIERIGRSDPFLMAAAISYNALFAIVPLAIASVAAVSLVGGSESALERFTGAVVEVLPPGVAEFVVDLVVETAGSLKGLHVWVIAVSLAVALYTGSRALYALIKALRLIQGTEDDRGWLVVRGLGIVFTVGAGVALVVGQIFILVGGAVLDTIEGWTGISVVDEVAGALVLPMLGLWTVALLAAVYRWGPPRSMPSPLLSGITAAAVVGAGSWLFGRIIPELGLSTIGILGAAGVALLWVYYMALVVIVMPELVGAAVLLVRRVGAGSS